MTAVLTEVAPPRTSRPRTRVLAGVGLALIVAVAYLVRLRLMTHGAPIAASDIYDDGVYYSAADALIHGRLPYRDFLLLHPPGIVVALTPFAALGSVLGDPVGVTVGRLVFVGIGAANAGLAAVIGWRHSRVAAAIAGAAYAVFFPLALAERSTLLEPLGSFLLLLGVLIARRGGGRAAIAAGLVAGLSMDVKIWYVVPVAVLAVAQSGHRLRFAGGAVASAAALGVVFLVQDPVAMIREVVFDQVGRPQIVPSLTHRLIEIAGDPFAGTTANFGRGADRFAVAVLAVTLVAAIAAWQVRWARVFVAVLAATVVVLLETPSFFTHYVALTAPWMTLVLGIGVGELLRRFRPAWLRAGIAGVLILAFAVANAPSIEKVHQKAQPVAALTRLLAGVHGCVVSDDPGLLANADVLTRDLDAGCPLWPDVTGWTYDPRDRVSEGRVTGSRQDDVAWQRDVLAYLTSGSAVVLNRHATGLDAATHHALAVLPEIGRAGRLVVHAVPR